MKTDFRNNSSRWSLKNQDLVNFFLSGITFVVCMTIGILFTTHSISLPHTISILDLFLILLATFRLTQYFVYDKSAQFFRDLFVDGPHKIPPPYGIRRSLYDLLSCPWCTGMWVALCVVFIYFLIPSAWIIILIFAMAGAGTFLQLLANLLGWSSEHTEEKVKKETGNK